MQKVHSSPSLKERQRQEREALILQAAEEAFAEKGYAETSMDEIAGRVGVAKGTVYLHFSCKEALVVAIFTRDMERFVESIEAAIASELSARAKLEALLKSMYTGLYRKRMQLLSSLYNNTDMQRMMSDKSNHIHALWERMAMLVTGLLEEGKQAGEFDTAIPTEIMLATFLGLLAPKTSKHLALSDKFTPDELITYVGRIFFDGVSARKSTHKTLLDILEEG